MPENDPFLGLVLHERYRLIRRLGAGGFGAVYQAEHVVLKRPFAVKVLKRDLERDPQFSKRFEREARLTASLEHAHIVQVTDFGHDDRVGTWFVMEHLRGHDLSEHIRDKGVLDSARAVHLMRAIVDAFQYAHSKGIVHRDVKSENIFLVTDETRTDHVKVLDFGIARISEGEPGPDEARLTNTGAVMGTVAYMAPEQALGLAIDQRTDIYALGIVLYEMVTGQVPFSATSILGVLNKHIQEPPPPPSELRPDLHVHPYVELTILKCLQKKMDDRYAATVDLAADLERAEAAIASGQDSPTELLATLSDLRSTLVRTGSELKGASEGDQRSLVAGAGYRAVDEAVGAHGAKRSFAFLAVAAMVLLLGALAVAVLRTTPPPPEGTTTAAVTEVSTPALEPSFPPTPVSQVAKSPGPTDKPPAPANVTIRKVALVTEPEAGARVSWEGGSEAALTTPTEIEISKTDEGRILVFEKAGFQRERKVFRHAEWEGRSLMVVKLKRQAKVIPRTKARVVAKPDAHKVTFETSPAGGKVRWKGENEWHRTPFVVTLRASDAGRTLVATKACHYPAEYVLRRGDVSASRPVRVPIKEDPLCGY